MAPRTGDGLWNLFSRRHQFKSRSVLLQSHCHLSLFGDPHEIIWRAWVHFLGHLLKSAPSLALSLSILHGTLAIEWAWHTGD